MRNTHRVQHVGFCGMRTLDEECDDEKEARRRAARWIRRARESGLIVSVLEKRSDSRNRRGTRGKRWEALESDDAPAIRDESGVLSIESPEEIKCWQCGFGFTPEEIYDRKYQVCDDCAAPSDADQHDTEEDEDEDG